MLVDYISEKAVCFDFACENKEDAIKKAVELLVESGNASSVYIDEVFASFEEYGSYIVMTPHIALPHAKPSQSVFKTGMSFLDLKTPIAFGHADNDPVSFVMAICAESKEAHLALLSKLASFLSTDNLLLKLNKVKSYEELCAVQPKA